MRCFYITAQFNFRKFLLLFTIHCTACNVFHVLSKLMLPIHPSYLLFPVPIALHFPRFRCWCRVVGSVLALSSVLNFVKNNTVAALYILHSHTGFPFLFSPSSGAAEGKGDPAGKIARRREAPQRGPTVQRGRSNVLRRRAKRKC